MTGTRTPTVDTREVPVLRGAPIIGPVGEIRRDYLAAMLRAAREAGPVARIDVGPPGWRASFYSVSSPDAVQQVLGRPELYTKDTPAYREVRRALGNGMLTSEGDEWRRQRRFLAPVFTPRRITTSYADVMVEEAQQLVARWRSITTAGGSVDVHAEMVGVTSRIIGRILFGADMSTAIPRILRVAHVNEALLRRGITPHALPIWLPTPANRRLTTGLIEIRGVVSEIVAARRAAPRPVGTDLLGLLLAARDEADSGDRLSDQEVTDQVLIFLLAGHETTATTLACALVELARSPQWQDRLRAELDVKLAGRLVSGPDVPALAVTGQVVREALRLYPSAHSIGRRSNAEDTLLGYRLPAGSSVVISPWAIHRSPAVWANPDRFDPARFDEPPGGFAGGHRFAWLPFGAGPHTCVGMQLALLEATTVLATIVQSFRLTTALTTVPLTAAVTLRPSRALPVQLHRLTTADR